ESGSGTATCSLSIPTWVIIKPPPINPTFSTGPRGPSCITMIDDHAPGSLTLLSADHARRSRRPLGGSRAAGRRSARQGLDCFPGAFGAGRLGPVSHAARRLAAPRSHAHAGMERSRAAILARWHAAALPAAE